MRHIALVAEIGHRGFKRDAPQEVRPPGQVDIVERVARLGDVDDLASWDGLEFCDMSQDVADAENVRDIKSGIPCELVPGLG